MINTTLIVVPGQLLSQAIHALVIVYAVDEGADAIEHGHGVCTTHSRDLQVVRHAGHVLEVLFKGIRVSVEQTARAQKRKFHSVRSLPE